MHQPMKKSVLSAYIAARWLAISLILIGFLSLAAYQYVLFFPGAFSSDASVHLTLARHLLQTGSWVSTAWYYPNNDIFAVGPHLLGMLAIQWLGFGLPALWVTSALTLGMLWICMYFCLRTLGFGTFSTLVGTSAALACSTDFHVEFLYIQAGYPFLIALYAVAFTLYIKLRVRDVSAPMSALWPWATVLMAIIGIVAVCNPSRAVAYVLGPMLLVELSPLTRPWTIRPRPLAYSMALFGVAGYAGYQALLHLAVHFSLPSGFRGITIDPHRAKEQFLQVLHFPLDIYAGFQPNQFGTLLSCALLALGVFLISTGALSVKAKILARLCLWQSLAVLVGGLIGGVFIEPYSVRYFLPAVIPLMATLTATCVELTQKRNSMAPLLFLGLFSAIIINANANLSALESKKREGGPVRHPHVLDRVAHEISAHGLKHGYSEWDANILNILAEGKTQYCLITYREQLLPFKWNVPLSCYDASRLPDRFFLILKPDHGDAARSALATSLQTQPAETFEVDGYTILVFDTKAADMSWLKYPVPDGANLVTPLELPAANPQMFSRVVQPGPNKTFEFKGHEGEIIFGPYITLNPGKYKLTWYGQLDSTDASGMHFYVQSESDAQALGSTNGRYTGPPSRPQNLAEIEFSVKKPTAGVNFIAEQRGHATGVITHYKLERLKKRAH
jgi:hypothetical protein